MKTELYVVFANGNHNFQDDVDRLHGTVHGDLDELKGVIANDGLRETRIESMDSFTDRFNDTKQIESIEKDTRTNYMAVVFITSND